MSSAAQSLIRTGVNPHTAFAQLADGAVIVSSQLDDPHGTLTLRYLGLAQKAAGISDEEKPGAKVLWARDEDIAIDTNLKLLNRDNDYSDAGRVIKGRVSRDKDKGSALDRLAEQFWLSGPSAKFTPEQLRRFMHDYRESQQSLRHG